MIYSIFSPFRKSNASVIIIVKFAIKGRVHMTKIILIEDDYYLAKNIRLLLEKNGYEVEVADNASDARCIIDNIKADMCVVDVMLPDGNGFELCSYIREVSQIPIIMISAKSQEEYIIKGLELGADDYVTKPFKPGEFISRVKANLRRAGIQNNTKVYVCEDLEFDIDKRMLKKSGEEIKLRNIEFKLLEIFVRQPEVVIKRDVFLERIWDIEGDFIEDNTLSVSIKRLREKIGDKPDGDQYISTIRGVGYRWNASVAER